MYSLLFNFLEEFAHNWFYFFLKYFVEFNSEAMAMRAWSLFHGNDFNYKINYCKLIRLSGFS